MLRHVGIYWMLQLFNVNQLQVVYSGKELNHPFGLSYHRNYIFWTDYMNGSIFQLDLISRNVTLLKSERSPLFGLQIYDPQKQQGIENNIFCIHTMQHWNNCSYRKSKHSTLLQTFPSICCEHTNPLNVKLILSTVNADV